MRSRWRSLVWAAGEPARAILLMAIKAYRLSLGGMLGGRCRFHPSCSEYAEQAIRSRGALRGAALAAWRVLRCSPLSSGGVDYPPTRRDPRLYDTIMHSPEGSSP